jgi:hypothetical protein
MQAQADSHYFVASASRSFTAMEVERIETCFLSAYRWQYITSGVQDPRFTGILGNMITPAQGDRIACALAPIVQ